MSHNGGWLQQGCFFERGSGWELVNEPRRDCHILGKTARTREANLIVASFTEIRQSHAAIVAGAAVQKALCYYLIAHRKSMNAFAKRGRSRPAGR